MGLSSGTQLGSYEILSPIGAGGMGEVEPLGRRLSRPAKSRAQRGIGLTPAGQPTVLFQGNFEVRPPYPSYDVAPDGKHFAMFEAAEGKSAEQVQPTVVINWFARVERLVAAGQK
jgi:hypothetical protein